MITREYIEARRHEVEAEKELFRNANPRERRLMIAKDVLAQVEAGRIIAKQGTLIKTGFLDSKQPHRELKEIFWEREDPCECCALGSIFLVTVERKDNICFASHAIYGPQVMMEQVIRDEFPLDQILLIEQAFERGKGFYSESVNAIAWGMKYADPTERLIAIMENIIRNNGNFLLGADQ